MNKIICKDNIIVMEQIPNNHINLTVTSPPYDNLRDYDGYKFDFERIAKELFRITKEGGVVVWIVADQVINGSESGTSFEQALFFKKIGFNLHDTMVWYKDTFNFPDQTRYRNSFEYMFVFSKGKPSTINLIEDRKNKWAGCNVHGTSRDVDGKTFRKSNHNKTKVKDVGVRFNVWEIPTEKTNRSSHPAPFPEKLAEDHILSWSNEGNIVFDPMCGTGTTCKMAKMNNRNYIGVDISLKYCEIAKERIDNCSPNLKNENQQENKSIGAIPEHDGKAEMSGGVKTTTEVSNPIVDSPNLNKTTEDNK
jgi:site-specific DNA-methyltransferase (adenine-specific)